MQTDFNSPWSNKIAFAQKEYEQWSAKFKCDLLWRYYEGKQWDNVNVGYNPYTFNEVYSTLAIKIASYTYAAPRFSVNPAPLAEDYNLDLAIQSSQLKEDTLNTLVRDPNGHFKTEVERAFVDSWFRFGLIECGYGADWFTNPNAPRPFRKSDKDPAVMASQDKKLEEPNELPINERIYFKRIAPTRFRIGGINSCYLKNADWYGYYDFVSRRDLLLLKGIKNRDKIETAVTAGNNGEPTGFLGTSSDDEPPVTFEDTIKIWHIWDNRAKQRRILLDGDFIELYAARFSRVCIFDLRWIYREEGFYPVPPVFHWLSPQDELNEIREQERAHRRRFTRKYTVVEGQMDDDEIDKFTMGGDGTVAKVKRDGALQPVQDANLGPTNQQSFIKAKDEFNILSGTSGEQRGVADRTTATQATLIAEKGSVRENYEAKKVSDWLCTAAREALILMREKYALGTWIERSVDPGNFLAEVQDKMPVYQWVTSEDISDGFDFRIDLDITSISPQEAEKQKQSYLLFLSLMNQFPQIALSPDLIVETAFRVGYRNMKTIRAFQQMAILQTMGLFQQAQQNDMGQGIAARETPTDQEQINNQVKNQGVIQ